VTSNRFNITLSDSVMPVCRLCTDVGEPGIVVNFVSAPRYVGVMVNKASVEVELFNPRHGSWEPVLEHFELSIKYTQKVGNDGIADTHLVLSGYKPLLLNVSPTVIRIATWFVPFFLDGFRVPSADEVGASSIEALDNAQHGRIDKYRVVNLCQQDVMLSFNSRHKVGLRTTVPPTGSDWQSLDEWILPYFADSVVVRLLDGVPSSSLALDRGVGAVEVPGGNGLFAELLTPHPSHRLLVIGSALRVHNQTDLPVVLRFHKAAQDMSVFETQLEDQIQCDAALFGHSPPSCTARSMYSERPQEDRVPFLLLKPNSLCSVPPEVCDRKVAYVSVRLAVKGVEFSAPFPIAPTSAWQKDQPMIQSCRDDSEGQLNLVCDGMVQISPAPACTPIATLSLRPSLMLINALPLGDLTVAIGTGAQQARWDETQVTCLQRFNVYQFGWVTKSGEFQVRARLGKLAPWSEPVSLRRSSLYRAHSMSEAVDIQELELRDRNTNGAAAGVNLVTVGRFALRLECPVWFSDRTPIADPYRLELRHKKLPLPTNQGVTLLPAKCMEEECELHMCNSVGQSVKSTSFRAPAGWGIMSLRTDERHYQFCLQSETIAANDVLGANCQVMTLRARLVVTNLADVAIEIRQGDQTGSLAPMTLDVGQSTEWHWRPKSDRVDSVEGTSLCFRQKPNGAAATAAWSEAVICSDVFVGSVSLASQGTDDVWSVDVASASGSWAMSFRRGSDFVVVNKATVANMAMAVQAKGCKLFSVAPGAEVPYGWPRQSTGPKSLHMSLVLPNGNVAKSFEIVDVQKTYYYTFPLLNIALSCCRQKDRIILELVDHVASSHEAAGKECQGSRMKVELKLGRLGLSLVQEKPIRELLYMQMQLIRLEFATTEHDVQSLKLAVSEGQIDCQLAGRVDGKTRNKRLADGQKLGIVDQEKPAVLFANCAAGDLPFLNFSFNRISTSSRDFVIPCAKFQVDAADFTVDDEWLEQLQAFAAQAQSMSGLEQSRHSGRIGLSVPHIQQMSGSSILKGYKVPPLPSVIQIESLSISTIDLTVWCSMALRSINFLSPQLRTMIMLLSWKSKLELDGASIKLAEQKVPTHRGSMRDFLSGLGSLYMTDLLKQAHVVLGRSSLLNLPRVPFKIGGVGVSILGETLTVGVDEATGLLDLLTFDNEYQKRQQEIRSQKKISNVVDGFLEAGSSLGNGLMGLTDVFTKPMEGAMSGGFGGFFKGIGQGVAGTLVRPVTGIATAVSDLGKGFTASVNQVAGTDTSQMRRNQARLRTRLPRLLFSELGLLQPWSDLDAEVLRQVGHRNTSSVEVVVPLTLFGPTRKILLLFPEHLLHCEVRMGDNSNARDSKFEAPPRAGDQFFSHLQKGGDFLGTTAGAMGGLIVGGGPAELVQEEPGDPEVLKRMQIFRFGALREVEEVGDDLKLMDTAGKLGALIRLSASGLGYDARTALAEGLRALVRPGPRRATWGPLRAALSWEADEAAKKDELACVSSSSLPTTGMSTSSSDQGKGSFQRSAAGSGKSSVAGGYRTLEVFELESAFPGTGLWSTPSMPMDFDTSWRWADASGSKHPNLKADMKKDKVIKCKEPPCSLEMFTPISQWTIDVNQNTNKDGWVYALNWRSSTWDKVPGMFAAVRKRRWTRDFS